MNFITAPTATGRSFEFKSNAKTPPRAAVIETDGRTGEERLFSKAASFTNAGKTANRFAAMHAKALGSATFLSYQIVAVHAA